MTSNQLYATAKTWLVLYTLFAICTSLVVANYWKKEVEKNTLNDLTSIVEFQKGAFQQFLYHYADHLLFFSKTKDVQEATNNTSTESKSTLVPGQFNEVEDEFSLYLAVEKTVMQLRLIDAKDGMELIRVERSNGATLKIPDAKLQNKFHRNYFQDMLELKNNDMYISDISLNQENGKISTPITPTIRLGRAILNRNQDIAAFIFMNINVDRLFNETTHKKFFGSNSYSVFLTNVDGDFLIHPNPEKTFGFEYSERHIWQDTFKDLGDEKRFEYIGNGLPDDALEYYILSRKIWLDNTRYVTLWVATSTQSTNWVKWSAFVYTLIAFSLFLIFIVFLFLRVRGKAEELRQQELLKSQERFHLIVESAPHGKIVVNDSGVIEIVNAKIEEIFGYTRDEMIGQPISILVPDSARGNHEHYRKVFMRKPSQRNMGKGQELSGRCKNGSLVPLEISLSPIKLDSEQKIICGIVDISERKKYESLFKTAIDSAPNAILMINDKGIIELTNRELENLFGYLQGEMIGQPVEMLLPERFKQNHQNHRAQYFKDPKKRPMNEGRDLFGLTADGLEIPIEVALQPVETNAGLKVFSSIFDLTDVLKREQKLRQLTDVLDRTNKIARIGGWEIDLETFHVIWSEQTYAIHEISDTNQQLTFDYAASFFDEKSQIKLKQHVEKAIVDHRGWDLELLLHTQKGKTRWVNVVGKVVFENGKPVKLVGTIQDISERKKVMEELERSNKDLNSFAYIASHDLKSPLRGVQQLTHWIEEDLQDNQNSEVTSHLHMLRSRVDRMEHLLDDLLAYSRAGREEAKLEVIDIEEFIQSVFDFCNVSGSFSLQLEGSKGRINVMRVPLEQVLRNLISNAMKHHDQQIGTITVGIEVTTSRCVFEVKDDGPGIEQVYRDQVFEIFKTLRPRDEVEGSGMGLAIVKKVIESQGGKIQLSANKPRGARFKFTWQLYAIKTEKE